MHELAYHCTIYMKAEEGETKEEVQERLERILEMEGFEYQPYDSELREV